MTLGARLKQLREDAKLTPYQLAVKAGLSGPCVYAIEKNATKPAYGTIQKICRALNISVSEFEMCEVKSAS